MKYRYVTYYFRADAAAEDIQQFAETLGTKYRLAFVLEESRVVVFEWATDDPRL